MESSPERFSGCVYGPRPTDQMYVIETDELYDMNLVGVPIRVEHMEGGNVGHVTSYTATPDGRGYVEFEVNDDAAGWTCADLIRSGRLGELSLKHFQDLDGKNKRPVEVSLVARGARPGTRIYPSRRKGGSDYISQAPQQVTVMASAGDLAAQANMMEEQAKRMREQAAAAAAAEAELHAASSKRAAESNAEGAEEAAKRARGPDGKFTAHQQQHQADPPGSSPLDFASILDRASADIRDPVVTKSLYEAVSSLMQNLDQKQSEIQKLQKVADEATGNAKGHVRGMAKQIATVLDGLYRRHASASFSDNQADMLAEAMTQFPKLGEALQPIMVAASDVDRQLAMVGKKVVDDQLEGYKAQVGALSAKIGAYQRMGGHIEAPPTHSYIAASSGAAAVWTPPPAHTHAAPAPNWTPVAAVPPPPAAAAAGNVEIAASGAGGGGAPRLPFEFRSYESSNSESKVAPSHFSKPVAAHG